MRNGGETPGTFLSEFRQAQRLHERWAIKDKFFCSDLFCERRQAVPHPMLLQEVNDQGELQLVCGGVKGALCSHLARKAGQFGRQLCELRGCAISVNLDGSVLRRQRSRVADRASSHDSE